MKKLISASLAMLSLIACDNDDERIVIDEETPADKEEVVEFTTFQVNYAFSADEDIRDFYHFVIAYQDIAGQQHIDTLKDDKWQYFAAPIPMVEAPDKFVFIVRMVRKDDVPELTKYAYTLSYEQDISVTLSNGDGSEVRTFDAGPMTSWSWQASPTAWAEWFVLHTNETLIDFRLEKTAFSGAE